MTQTLAMRIPAGDMAVRDNEYGREKLDLLKRTVCKGSTDSELELFVHVCKRTGLDPFARQIHAVKRYQDGGQVMTIQTGIDGYRLIADRTGRYTPGREPSFTYDKDGFLQSATAYVKKQTADGTWHEVCATAHYSEYVGLKRDGNPNAMWANKPHIMLGKCFSADTEVLTTRGFEKFSTATGAVMQVTDEGLRATTARPWSKPYGGSMVLLDSDDLNFCVTPNHSMVTTAGRIDAGDLYEAARARPMFWIPRIVPADERDCANVSDMALMLAGAYLADGSDSSATGFRIEVSKPRKVEALRQIGGFVSHRMRHCAGDSVDAGPRVITTKSDKTCFAYKFSAMDGLVHPKKEINLGMLVQLSRRQARILIDTLIEFDGHTQKSGVRRFYSSRPVHLRAFELAAVIAGYSVSNWKQRTADIGGVNHYLTISDRNEIPVVRWGRAYGGEKHATQHHNGLRMVENPTGEVWCVTVPSGKIVVRRNGFSMICGNCAEALALRRAFPAELSGVYTKEEMEQADNGMPQSLPDADVDEDFHGQWIAAIESRGGTEEQAGKMLAGLMKQAGKTLASLDGTARANLIRKARDGGFDKYLAPRKPEPPEPEFIPTEPDIAGIPDAPERPVEDPAPAMTPRDEFFAQVHDLCNANGITDAVKINGAVQAWAIKVGKKGKEHEATQEQKDALFAAAKDRRGVFAYAG